MDTNETLPGVMPEAGTRYAELGPGCRVTLPSPKIRVSSCPFVVSFLHRWALMLWVWCLGASLFAAADQPVVIQPGSAKYEAEPGGTLRLRLHVAVEEPYHIYGPELVVGPRGQGPAATSVSVVENPVITLAGGVTTSPGRRAFDPNFDLELSTLESRSWLEVPLRVKPGTAPGEYRVELIVNYQACTPESCLPPGEQRIPIVVTVRLEGEASRRAVRAADEAFAEFRAVAAAAVTVLNDRVWYDRLGPAGRDDLTAASAELTVALGEKLLADFPGDARRWSVIATLLRARRDFVGAGAETRRSAWWSRRDTLRDELVAAPDAPEGVVASVLELAVYACLGGRWAEPGAAVDEAAALKAADRMRNRVPGSDRRKFAEQHVIEHLISNQRWEQAETRLMSLASATDENAVVATMATGVLKKLALRREPLEMSFTALDGTPFNLAALRGKVVLIDFWATWCVPCMEEMPEIKRVYAAYRDRGFEVVGISFDSLPRDPAKPRVQERTAEQVSAFVRREGMSWPHYFDGKGWDNRWGRTFSIAELPTGFLLDRSGRLVHLDNHGSKLEANVRKLLGL